VTHSWNIPERTEAEIKKTITDNIDKYIWTGFTGSFLTFLEPLVRHTDTVDIIDINHTEREGGYMVSEVVTNFGTGGGRQEITLRNKVRDKVA